jgi:hypothetical protein
MSNIVQGSEENPITAQMIFNAAWQRFIIEEAPPAVRQRLPYESNAYSNYLCSYLTENGRKCAVGLCLPDGHIIQQSNKSLPYLCVGEFHKLFNLSSGEQNTLQSSLHDDLIHKGTGQWLDPLEVRKEKYINIAKFFNLTIPESQTNA